MRKTMTTVTFKVSNDITTRMHIRGEVKFSSLTREVQKWFDGHTTNHFGATEEAVLQDCFIEIADDIICEIEIDDYDDSDIIIFSSIEDFNNMIIEYSVLALATNIFS